MPYIKCELPKYPCEGDVWDGLRAEGRPIIVYGMGNGADKLINRLNAYGVEISDFFASDGFVRGHCFHGKRVKSFSEIKENYSDFVILLSFASNRTEVIEMLADIDANYELLIPDMPVSDETEYFDREFYNRHYEEIREAYQSLADEDSRSAFASILNYKLTGKMSYLLGAYSTKEEIYSLINQKNIKTVIDAGAYNGDTVMEAIKYFSILERVIAVEADPKNYKRLLRNTESIEGVKIEAVNAAVWNTNGEGSFNSGGNRNSSVSSTVSYQHKDAIISLITVDGLSLSEVDYIKYDVEGAEYEALLGSQKTIKSTRPVLLVSLYHKSRDIFFLINYLKREYKDYDFYLRRLLSVPAWEIDLIMLPKRG